MQNPNHVTYLTSKPKRITCCSWTSRYTYLKAIKSGPQPQTVFSAAHSVTDFISFSLVKVDFISRSEQACGSTLHSRKLGGEVRIWFTAFCWGAKCYCSCQCSSYSVFWEFLYQWINVGRYPRAWLYKIIQSKLTSLCIFLFRV